MAVVEMRNQTVVWHQGAHAHGGLGFQERLGWFLQLELYVLPYGALGCGLYWPTTLACSDIKSLTEGAIGQCSSGWTVDWQLMHGLACAGFSVTACTSCSLFLPALPPF